MEANSRDVYGFPVRPQHLQRYHECAKIYKEEEEERSKRWNGFLDKLVETVEAPSNEPSVCTASLNVAEEDNNQTGVSGYGGYGDIATEIEGEVRSRKVQGWCTIRSSLTAIEQMMSYRVKKWTKSSGDEETDGRSYHTVSEESRGACIPVRKPSEETPDKEFSNAERSEEHEASSTADLPLNEVSRFPWKEELESLVRGGVPMSLRGELWQAFAGTKARRIEGYYDELLAVEIKSDNGQELKFCVVDETDSMPITSQSNVSDEWKRLIEKDLTSTFPGHPSLDDDGRNSLRNLLMAYARHNPSVGYFQPLNIFAGLLLLLMPEENAFWTLVGIIDDYFDGYYSDETIESEVDLLILDDLARGRFPALVNHLDYLGVQVAWITGSWFLSIFVNMLPWESVLRVWDVLLFDGNRVMLFRTALALMELYGAALKTAKDAGETVTLLQNLIDSTFESSQLVSSACKSFHGVNEMKLKRLRNKHRPYVIHIMEERSKGLHAWEDSQCLTSKLSCYKYNREILYAIANSTAGSCSFQTREVLHPLKYESAEGYLSSLTVDAELDTVPDLKEQVTCLKVELCRLLEEKRLAVLRAEELEMALMEVIKKDNRRLLSVKVEQLQKEVSTLQYALAEKQQKEDTTRQALMRMEQERKVAEDTRMIAEQDAAAQKYAAHMLQEKYEEAMATLALLEKRAVIAETMLERTKQNGSSPGPSSPRFLTLLSRPFGWLDKNKNIKLEVASSDAGSGIP